MDWVLPLFPDGSGLGQSVITTVWVGIAVVCMLNLRFGFPLTGLVVPGYLVPLLIVSPVSAVVIILEAIVVYVLMRCSAKVAMERLGYAEMFGRDRFFAIILISILVRVFMDTLFWPQIGQVLALWDITFDYAGQLYSLGLVIIALTANVMWNGGFRYGMRVTLIQLAITFILVRFVLMPFTNFSIANLAIMYEAVAASILAAPKAYIILVITAFLASRANIRYGWEFNGIMLPALLALQLMQPSKLLTTFIETTVILSLGAILLNLTRLKHANFEGARLLLLFFNIGFFYKLVLNYFVVDYFPTLKATDTFAFGYMLSTLLALKIYQKNALGLVLRATFQTSMVGGLLAFGIGFAIMFVPSLIQPPVQPIEVEKVQSAPLSHHVSEYKSYLYTARYDLLNLSHYQQAQQLQRFRSAIRLLNENRQDPDTQQRAALVLAELGFALIDNPATLVIKDTQTTHPRGFFALAKSPVREHIVTVPYPTSERLAGDAAGQLFAILGSRALALGTRVTPSVASQQTRPQSAYYQAFVAALNSDEVLQLRAINQYTRPQLKLTRFAEQSQFWIYNQLPESLSQRQLTRLLGFERSQFGLLSEDNLPYPGYQGAMLETFFDNLSYSTLLSHTARSNANAVQYPVEQLNLPLDELVTQFSQHISAKGSGHFRMLEENEAALWEYEVLEPLFKLSHALRSRAINEDDLNRLEQLNRLANMVGYRLQLVINNAHRLVVISPLPEIHYYQQGQGFYAINLNTTQPLTIQVPRPLFESNTLQFATDLFQTSGARALLIAGAHPYASEEANVMAPTNTRTLYNVVHQSAVRHNPGMPVLSLQVRSHSAPSQIRPSALAYQFTQPDFRHISTINALRKAMARLGISVEKVSGQVATRGLEIGSSPQSGYRLFSPDSELATLWLASDFKQHYAVSEQALQERLLAVSTLPRFMPLRLAATGPNDWVKLSDEQMQKLDRTISRYAQTQHLPWLSALCDELPRCQLQAIRLSDNQLLGLHVQLAGKTAAVYLAQRNRLITLEALENMMQGGPNVLD
ncbi:poly-gamma-glutamate biosynthesis protein PgsC/CapC [Pseudoalteromonas viridis]|uniref:Capsule biosynthesis CapC n=1 Tax=Pseudoalteromonas viridis TaxID=339617 RepID=A0ABX7UZU4_9GAMM|nr:poly-gamma-glutamate biosynthesis protein PgsC/CapC [Pseudoalteromonas viridis]QTL34161.1 hypothetical protein J5X90_11310 [Pseudoalteromonas viridis]